MKQAIPLHKIVTHRFSIDEAETALKPKRLYERIYRTLKLCHNEVCLWKLNSH